HYYCCSYTASNNWLF
nr:immunoglobulin light chain junction region [Macaca mulatta]MOW29776.1 immunoglobulin light chain junction region [Macaca mulatta]